MTILLGKEERTIKGSRTNRLKWPAIYTSWDRECGPNFTMCNHNLGSLCLCPWWPLQQEGKGKYIFCST